MPKKSNFITDSEVPDGHFFDTFGNGVNRKISKENLFAQIQSELLQTYYYDSEDDLKAADLEADPDNPIYVRVAPAWRLYRITSLAPVAPYDIALDNGATATLDRLENLQFINVQDMKDAPYLKEGDLVEFVGYSTPGDGGGNKCEIGTGFGTADNGSIFDLSFGGLQAKGLFPNQQYYMKQWGVVADGVTDDLAQAQAAIDYVESLGGGTLYLPRGTMAISGTLTIQAGSVQLFGQGRGGTFFSTDDNSASTILYTGSGSEPILDLGNGADLFTGILLADFTIKGNAQTTTGTIGCRLNHGLINNEFRNVHTLWCAKHWELLGIGSAQSFNNKWTNCTIEHFTDFGIDIFGDGNGSRFKGCKFASTFIAGTPQSSVRVGQETKAHGISFDDCSFGSANVTHHIEAIDVQGLGITNCEIESSGSSTTPASSLVKLGDRGTSQSCEGFCITGTRFIGNSQTVNHIDMDNARGGVIGGNYFAGSTDVAIFNNPVATSTVNTTVMGNSPNPPAPGLLNTEAGLTLFPDANGNPKFSNSRFLPPANNIISKTSDYTFALADAEFKVQSIGPANVTFTVPPESTENFPIGTEIEMVQVGIGIITVAPGAGVTFVGAKRSTSGIGDSLLAYKRASDSWVIMHQSPSGLSSHNANYTLQLSDIGKIVENTGGSGINITIPPESTANFPLFTEIECVQEGLGAVTVVAGSGVTLTGATLTTGGGSGTVGDSIRLYKRATDEWVARHQ